MTESIGFYNLARVRSEAQEALYKKLEAEGVCMFCPEGLERAGVPIVKEGRFWLIAKNKHPYDGTIFHYLGIYRIHMEAFHEVLPFDWPELFKLLSEVTGRASCSIAIRSGNTNHTCSTVSHFHVHAFAGDAGHPNTHEELIMHLGYKAK